jgi:hypothetical protein
LTKNYSTFYPKICHYALKNNGLGSGIRDSGLKKPIPDPGVKKAPDHRSMIRIHNVVKNSIHQLLPAFICKSLYIKGGLKNCAPCLNNEHTVKPINSQYILYLSVRKDTRVKEIKKFCTTSTYERLSAKLKRGI